MKRYILFTLMTSICLFMGACQKYLDVKTRSSQVLVTTAAQCQGILNNSNSINNGYTSDGEVSSDDYVSGVQSGEDLAVYTWTGGRTSANPQWEFSYYNVEQANLVLETIPNIHDGTPQATLDMIKAEALFFRSYSFWELAQVYCKPYVVATATTDLGISIRTSTDIAVKSTRATVQQTYDQIVSDLKSAVASLPETQSFPTLPSKGAAYAMLARVYLSMSDYPDALTNAMAALAINNQLTDFNTLDQGSDFPFSNSTHFIKDEYFYSNAAYAGILDLNGNVTPYINPDIINSYAQNDLRAGVYLTPYGSGSYFAGNYNDQGGYSYFFDGLATDEIYLTRAECYARAGDVTNAMNDLNALLVTRWATGTYVNITAATSDDALAIILAERRKELIMRFTRWTDLRRLNLDPKTAVTLTRVVNGTTYTLPPNDPRYTLLIPFEVIQTTGFTQNPR